MRHSECGERGDSVISLPNDIDPHRLIEDFLLDCAHGIDDDKLEEWPDAFTEDAIYQIIPRESYEQGLPLGILYCEGKGMMIDRINALRTANIYEPHVYCHMVGAVEMLDHREGEYHTRANFTVLRTMAEGDMSIFACGRYIDVIVDTTAGMKFKQRTIVLDSRRIDTLLVIPV